MPAVSWGPARWGTLGERVVQTGDRGSNLRDPTGQAASFEMGSEVRTSAAILKAAGSSPPPAAAFFQGQGDPPLEPPEDHLSQLFGQNCITTLWNHHN